MVVYFRRPWVARQLQTPRFAFINEARLHPGMRSWAMHWSDWARCQRAICGISNHNEVKSWDSIAARFTIQQFQTMAWKKLQIHHLAERFILREWWSRLSERGSQDLSSGTSAASEVINRQVFYLASQTRLDFHKIYQEKILGIGSIRLVILNLMRSI
jgi:hypothetical protein